MGLAMTCLSNKEQGHFILWEMTSLSIQSRSFTSHRNTNNTGVGQKVRTGGGGPGPPRGRDRGFCQVWGCMPETLMRGRLRQEDKKICKATERISSQMGKLRPGQALLNYGHITSRAKIGLELSLPFFFFFLYFFV